MTTVFHETSDVKPQKHRATSGKRNFIERVKAPIFLEPVLAIRAQELKNRPIQFHIKNQKKTKNKKQTS